MASVLNALASSATPEKAQFLNDIISQLWPHINEAATKILKDSLEPIFASSLPGPLATLRFTKLDLGDVPIRFSRVDVHKTENGGINLDMDLDWKGDCKIDLDGEMVPKMGIESITLQGRMSVLLCPLTNIIPLIGAAQIAFLNRPHLALNFTGAADLADTALLAKTVRATLLTQIAAAAVLPNRSLTILDPLQIPFFATYQPAIGLVRLTLHHADGLHAPKPRGGVMGLLQKLTKDVPDCFCRVTLGANTWTSSVQANTYTPAWNETSDFVLCDAEQMLHIEMEDEDLATADDLGEASVSVQELLRHTDEASALELPLVHNGSPSGVRVRMSAQLHRFVPTLSTATIAESTADTEVLGYATFLIASAHGLTGQRDEIVSSVKVSWGEKCDFRTATVSYSPGVDIFNPCFNATFIIPLTAALLREPPETIRLALWNKEEESGAAEVPFASVLDAPEMAVEDHFDVGMGATVRAKILVRGLQLAE